MGLYGDKKNTARTNSKSEKRSGLACHPALADYYDDLLGSNETHPLKNLEEQEGSSLAYDSTDASEKRSKESDANASIKLAKKNKPFKKTAVKELDSITLAQPVIISGLPKLAPPKVKDKVAVKQAAKVRTQEKQSTSQKSAINIQVKSNTQQSQKIDRKAAIAQLIKNRDKLTTKQILALKSKLSEREYALVIKAVKEETRKSAAKPVSQTAHRQVSAQKSQSKTADVKRESIVAAQPKTITKTHSSASQDSATSDGSDQLSLEHPVYPAWASGKFECLIFTVAGLKLAVPLVTLGAVYKIEKQFTPIPGRANYFLGLYYHLDRNVRVLDTARWVMPDRWSEIIRERYKFIIRLGGSDWGLACDSIQDSIALTIDDIRWRSNKTKRQWLAGTVIERMCALLDVDVLKDKLEQELA